MDLQVTRAIGALMSDLAQMMVMVPARRAVKGPLRPGWSARLEIFFEVLVRDAKRTLTMSPAQLRSYRDNSALLPPPRDIRFDASKLAGVPCEWAIPKSGGSKGVVLYLHGGCYVFGSPKTVRVLVASLAREADVKVASLDYRLAPDHTVVDALDDSVAAARALFKEYGASRVAIAGDSAGGGLALSTMIALRDGGGPLPCGAALLSPWLDLAGRIKSSPERRDWAPPGFGAHYAKIAAAGMDPTDLRLSPIEAKLEGLPRTLVQIGTAELLYDEVSVLNARLAKAGVELVLDEIENAYHSIQYVDAPEADAARSHVAAFLRGAFDRAGKDA